MPSEFHYQIPWRSQGRQPGHHPCSQAGAGFEYLGSVPFANQPDARHLDVRAMLADPFGQLMVKNFRQRAAIPVYLLADVSASMGFRGKTAILAEFGEALAWSAWRTGDAFGCFVCDERIHWELSLPLRLHKGVEGEWRERIGYFQASGSEHQGLLEAALSVGRQRALVFLVSDFHLQYRELEALFNALALHDVVPVVLWDSGEYQNLPNWGWARWQDAETGERRSLFLRPSLREKIRLRYMERREALMKFCSAHGREPFFLIDHFDAEAMTRYFYPA